MIFAITGRRQGKTRLVVEWLMEDFSNRYIVVSNSDRKDHVVSRIKNAFGQLGLEAPEAMVLDRVLLPGEYTKIPRGRVNMPAGAKVAIDDIETILMTLYGPVELVTGTGTLVRPSDHYPNKEE